MCIYLYLAFFEFTNVFVKQHRHTSSRPAFRFDVYVLSTTEHEYIGIPAYAAGVCKWRAGSAAGGQDAPSVR